MSRFMWPLRVVGAGLLAATAAIHLDLYLTGYQTIPTIGWMFLLQVIVAFALALAVLAAPLVARSGRLPAAAAAAGAAFAIATLGGYLLSLWVGLFGFREVRTTAGIVAGIIDVAAFAVLALLAAASLTASTAAPAHAARTPTSVPAARAAGGSSAAVPAATSPEHAGWAGKLHRYALPAVAAASVAAFVVLGISVATANGSSGPAASSTALIKTTTIGGVTVLTNASGRTLYWFAPDSSSASVCYGTCAVYWPPVYGKPTVASGVTGVTGKLGTIHRNDGTTQATYNGHPLYTYVSDTAPGDATGNNVNLNGGYWYEMKASG